jgi:hypothetical protein
MTCIDYEGERADDQIKEDKIEKAFELDNLKFDNKQLKACLNEKDKKIEMLKKQRNVLIRLIDNEFTINGHFSDDYSNILFRCEFFKENLDVWHSNVVSINDIMQHIFKHQEELDIKYYQ